jgi:hypothetical protein
MVENAAAWVEPRAALRANRAQTPCQGLTSVILLALRMAGRFLLGRSYREAFFVAVPVQAGVSRQRLCRRSAATPSPLVGGIHAPWARGNGL